MKPSFHPFRALLLCLFILFPTGTQGEMTPFLKIKPGTPPYDIIRDLLAPRDTLKPHPKGIDKDHLSTAIDLIWLADTDSRNFTWNMTKMVPQNALVINNFGNQVSKAAAQIDYGVRILHSPILFICGVTDSPALQMLTGIFHQRTESIDDEIRNLEAMMKGIGMAERPTTMDGQREIIELNVDEQVALAVRRYRDRIDIGRLIVIGGVLDYSGLYGRGNENLLIININGETDSIALRNHPVLRKIPLSILTRSIGKEKP
ncbi:MAG: DNA/RNA non-specific endonuclease [Proteobacteria bacterium]|nr:DNA/RNA non-specific endonuclease [Pseudomonadota bacterium]MBU1688022.1 DNA/RNA non-specific endonuclease [Pseudomonadota bacterium]